MSQGNLNDCSTWIFEWMTETEKITCSADQFIAMLHFPRFEFDKSREHRLHFWDVTEEQLHLLMDSTKVGDACPADHSPKNLTYENMVLFHIMCNSLTPVNRPEKIERLVRNTLQALSMGIPFDLEDLFLRNLASAAEYPQVMKPYAPWIQYAIEQITGKRFLCRFKPKVFIPPVRDTLRIVKEKGKGKAPAIP